MATETFEIKVDSSGAVTNLKSLQTGLKKTGDQAKKTNGKVNKFAKSLIGPLGLSISLLTVATSANAAVQEFRKYEKALVGVAKTTNIAGEELEKFAGQITKLTKDLKGAATERELLSIAQAAGQLGVKGTKSLLKFSETIAKLGLASDLAGESAATTLTRILTVTGEGAGAIEVFASQIVALGNDSAASESEIAQVANEIARSTAVFNVSAGQAAALAASLKSVGVQAELGGSAMGKAFRVIDSAVRNGGRALENLSELTGKTGDEIKRIFQDESVRAFQLFVEGLGEIQRNGGDTTAELAKFGLKGEEILKVLPVLAKRADLVARSLNTIGAEAKNGAEALEKETSAALKTLDARFKKFNNEFTLALRNIGETLAPVATFVLNGLTNDFEDLNELLTETKDTIEDIGKATAKLADKDLIEKITDGRSLSLFKTQKAIAKEQEESEKELAAQLQIQKTILMQQEFLATRLLGLEKERLGVIRAQNAVFSGRGVVLPNRQAQNDVPRFDANVTPEQPRFIQSDFRPTQPTAFGPEAGFGQIASQFGTSVSSFASSVGLWVKAAQQAAAFPKNVESTVNGILDDIAEWGVIIERFTDELPDRVADAVKGAFEALDELLAQSLEKAYINAQEAFAKSLRDELIRAFGGTVEQTQTRAQTAALNGLIDSIKAEAQAIERAGWTGEQWQSELRSLEQEKRSLERVDSDFYDDLIDISTQQFEVIKNMNQLQVEQLQTLKQVSNSLDDTLNSLIGSTLNPDQTFATAEAAYQQLLEDALAQGLGAGQREEVVGDLTAFVTGFLEKAQAQFGTSAQFQNIFAQVQDDLKSVRGLVDRDATDTEQAIDDRKAALERLQKQIESEIDDSTGLGQTVFDKIKQILDDIWGFLNGFVREVFNAIKSAAESIEELLRDIKSIFDSVGGGGGSSGGIIGGLLGGVTGGIIGGAFANGGISTIPQLAMVSEGSFRNEAHVPLPDGRSIPVTLNNDSTVSELKKQNQLLMQLISVTANGLQLDGQSFSRKVAMISSATMQESINRGRIGEPIAI